MRNKQPNNDRLTPEDVLVLFMLRAPDMKKAIAALVVLFGRKVVKRIIVYKNRFESYQDWHIHLIAALNNAQDKIEAKNAKQKEVKQ